MSLWSHDQGDESMTDGPGQVTAGVQGPSRVGEAAASPGRRRLGRLLLVATLSLAASSGFAGPEPKAAEAVVGFTPEQAHAQAEQALVLGERMYREGLLPSGEPMRSVVSGDVPVPGASFSCVSCHLRAGLGFWEGGVATLPINGAKLAQPRYAKFPNLSPEERKELRLQTPEARPSYTDEALARVIRTGVDPSGRKLHPAMPRFDLKDADMALLIHYLRGLSATLSPGADGETIRFATVIAGEVSPADEQSMLVPLNNFVARHNQHSAGFANRMYLNISGQEMTGAYRKLSLSVWRLKGAPETWGRQLEAHLEEDPVFALLGGLASGPWRLIHEFCERRHLPCLFPLTDLPVVSNTDWYTQYFSKGYYQEGQAAARYLHGLEERPKTGPVLQIVEDGAESWALADGFRETWQELEEPAATEIRLGQGESISPEALRALLAQDHPMAILLWSGAGAFPAVEALADQAGRPGYVFMSSRLLSTKLTALPEKARAFTWLTYPYREPQDEPGVSRRANSLLAGLSEHHPETRIATRTYALLQVFQAGLMEMDRNLYRDNLLDRIGMQRDYVLPDYLRLSFGPGQRYASKGCFIMQLGPGPEPQLLRRSDWVIH